MTTTNGIQVTDTAVAALKDIISKDPDVQGMPLRIFVQGGGCSGFQYGFTFDEGQAAEDDTVVEKDGVTILVDSMSIQYLQNAEIDYKSTMTSSQFVIQNPNAVSTCGCGSSFSA